MKGNACIHPSLNNDIACQTSGDGIMTKGGDAAVLMMIS